MKTGRISLIIYGYLLIFLLANSCCRKREMTGYATLSEQDLSAVPYKLNESVKMRHSGGSLIIFSVSNRHTSRDEVSDCKGCCTYHYEDENRTEIQSVSPEINITITLRRYPESQYHYNLDQSISLQLLINRSSFNLDSLLNLSWDSSYVNFIDTMNINNQTYFNCIRCDGNSYPKTEDYIYPKQIIYCKSSGIVKIIMSNEESYTLEE